MLSVEVMSFPVIHGLSMSLVDYALVFTKNMEEFVRNFRWMFFLLIQSIMQMVLRVTNSKAAVSGKCQIPVEVVSPLYSGRHNFDTA